MFYEILIGRDMQNRSSGQRFVVRPEHIFTGVLLYGLGWAVIAARQAGVGSLSKPGPGLWPLSLAIFAILISVVILVKARPVGSFGRGASYSLLLAAALVGFVLLYPYIGYIIPMLALLMLHLLIIGRERLLTSVLVAVLATGGTYYVFSVLLGANFEAF